MKLTIKLRLTSASCPRKFAQIQNTTRHIATNGTKKKNSLRYIRLLGIHKEIQKTLMFNTKIIENASLLLQIWESLDKYRII